MLLILFFTFLLSLFIGSFLNVVIDRTARGEQFVKGRSYCEKCKHVLNSRDLIPVFSFLSLKGKCRYCKKPIPKSLFVVEVSTAVIFTSLTYYLYNQQAEILTYIFFYILASILLSIFISDLKYMLISDLYLILLGSLYFVYFFVISIPSVNLLLLENLFFVNIYSHLLAGLVMFLFFGGLYLITKKRAMGDGDVFLAGLLALYLGLNLSLIMWYVAFISGALVGVFLIIKGSSAKTKIPFGPFLILGFVIALIFGSKLIDYYLLMIS